MHEKYGEVVRSGPNALSFINEMAWKDIYMHRQGQQHRQMEKTYTRRAANGSWDIIGAPDDVHGRLRRGLSHAFSERSLREQEPLIKNYVDLLISNICEDAEADREFDMVAYLSFLTFDLIGDLAFAEPFNALKTRTTHPWMATFFRSVKVGTLISQLMIAFPPLKLFVGLLAYPLRGVQRRQFKYCADRVDSRIESGSERPDLMREVLKGNKNEEPGKGMTRDEIKATFDILILAGSETAQTLLSGCLYLLMSHPDVYAKLQKEVRGAFASDDEITAVRVHSVDFQGECLITNRFIVESIAVPPSRPRRIASNIPPGSQHPTTSDTARGCFYLRRVGARRDHCWRSSVCRLPFSLQLCRARLVHPRALSTR